MPLELLSRRSGEGHNGMMDDQRSSSVRRRLINCNSMTMQSLVGDEWLSYHPRPWPSPFAPAMRSDGKVSDRVSSGKAADGNAMADKRRRKTAPITIAFGAMPRRMVRSRYHCIPDDRKRREANLAVGFPRPSPRALAPC